MEFPTVPRFLPDLRAGLATLYQTNTPSKEAHDFCLFVQSRNARRKVRSWQQQQQDQPSGALPSADFVVGSSWLACLALLLQNVSHTERLFCAQSLLHRVRRVPITEAVDWEFENSATALQPTPPAAALLDAYRNWMRRMNPAVAQCIEGYHSAESQERVKGELTLLTVASILHHELTENNIADPLCTTLASILATTALRLRFCDSSSTSLIVCIRHAFAGVTAESNCLGLSLTLIAIPETVFTNAAGNKLSIDPKCIQTISHELRTVELPLLFQCLPTDEIWVLRLGEAWARYLPLPEDFIRQTASIMVIHWNSKVSLKYWLAIMESAVLTADEIVSQSLGLADGQQFQQATKKRLSGRAKKKKQAKVEQDSTEEMYSHAEWDVRHRGAMACAMVVVAWNSFNSLVKDVLMHQHHHQVDGEGPLGCLAACANACLPFILRYRDTPNGSELFLAISESFHGLCKHQNTSVRALALEPIDNLHTALLESIRDHGPLVEPLESFVVDHFSKCVISLASVCAYPPDYFNEKAAPSDEDLEIQRNDVRDVVRTVSGSGESGSTSDAVSIYGPISTTLKILSEILKSCHQAVTIATESGELLPEPAVHTLSALAKPLNAVAKFFVDKGGDADIQRLLEFAFSFLCRTCTIVVELFHAGTGLEDILPRCRTAAIAVASLSPMISSMSMMNILDGNALSAIFDMSALSIEHIPELFAESTLQHSQYDIRGTMRGPGGEDHVGCLSLMRLTKESEILTRLIIALHADTFVPRLCRLHQLLKAYENERGVHVAHGKGVTPSARRILLGILSHLEVTSKGQAGASSVLEELFNNAIQFIAQCNNGMSFDERSVCQIAEHTFDLVAFSPSILVTLFANGESSSNNMTTACLECLTSTCITGYNQLSLSEPPSEAIIQWNRLRAALLQFFRTVLKVDMSQRLAEMIRACALAELEAIHRQCELGNKAGSFLFLDDVISEDSIPAGIFLRVVGENLYVKGVVNQASLFVLMECQQACLSVVAHSCSDPMSFVDPRPALLEAWLFSMIELANAREHVIGESMLVETFVVAITFIFMSSLGKTEAERRCDPGMSMDGPHSLMMVMFLIRFLELGPQILKLAAERLVDVIPINPSSTAGLTDALPLYQGMAIIGAGLFRAAEGSLPPWVVEMCPEIYSSLYSAMGKNSNDFVLLFRWSMELRLSSDVPRFGGVSAGRLLSGHAFEKLSDKTKLDFLKQASELATNDDVTSWRRMKVLIKQISGGKKKDTDFRQKPSLTRWEFLRV